MSYEFVTIATGIEGCEGPVFNRSGRLFVVSPPRGSIFEIDVTNGQKREHANTGAIPAGLQVDRDNNLWVADMRLGILRVDTSGEIQHVVGQYAGEPIRGCNDCVFDSQGNLYFTAPAGSSLANRVGEVYCRTVEHQVNLIDGGYAFSNGIAVSANDSLLIVAETFTKSLWAYDIESPGIVSNKRLFARLPGDDSGGPDGLDFDVLGNLLAAHWKGSSIDVFDQTGRLIERIMMPFEKPSNIQFGGLERTSLYITELTQGVVLETRWPYPGQLSFAEQNSQ